MPQDFTALAIELLNNRELANVTWLLGLAVVCLFSRSIRISLAPIGHAVVKPPLPEVLVILVMYVSLICLAAHRLDFWTTDLISETVWWFVGTALVLLVNINVAIEETRFYRRVAFEVLGFTLLLDFLMNDLFVFSLPVELLLLPVLTFFAMLTVVAQMDTTKRQVASMTGCLQVLAGLSIAAIVVVKVISNWSQVTTETQFLEFISPVWLTLAFLPFLYVISVLVAYQTAFRRIARSIRKKGGSPMAFETCIGCRPRRTGQVRGRVCREMDRRSCCGTVTARCACRGS
jgi:hypothetical protein